MTLAERIESFTFLGETLRDALNGRQGIFSEEIDFLIKNQVTTNPWFTPENVKIALEAIASELTEDNLTAWTNAYPELREKRDILKAAVIMAGNIPLVGFHDFLCVLISGNSVIAKTSSKDSELIRLISRIICSANNNFTGRIEFTEDILAGFDVVIATGSNNSSRYFEYYFGKYPHIIRRNRNSIAILEGDETEGELESLGKDIFSYFGLGCRNISKLYLPAGYDMSAMVSAWQRFSDIISHNKYANNYDYNKAVYLVNKEKFFDTGFLLMKEDESLLSPVSVLNYEFYESLNAVEQQVKLLQDKIQCIVSRNNLPFGKAQYPFLWDYADGIDTIDFLLKKK